MASSSNHETFPSPEQQINHNNVSNVPRNNQAKKPKFTDNYHVYRNESLDKASPKEVILEWLARTFCIDETSSVPKHKVYDEYQRYCEANEWTPLSAASCGRLVHKVFPTVTCSRKGGRGTATYHYGNLGYIDRSKNLAINPRKRGRTAGSKNSNSKGGGERPSKVKRVKVKEEETEDSLEEEKAGSTSSDEGENGEPSSSRQPQRPELTQNGYHSPAQSPETHSPPRSTWAGVSSSSQHYPPHHNGLQRFYDEQGQQHQQRSNAPTFPFPFPFTTPAAPVSSMTSSSSYHTQHIPSSRTYSPTTELLPFPLPTESLHRSPSPYGTAPSSLPYGTISGNYYSTYSVSSAAGFTSSYSPSSYSPSSSSVFTPYPFITSSQGSSSSSHAQSSVSSIEDLLDSYYQDMYFYLIQGNDAAVKETIRRCWRAELPFEVRSRGGRIDQILAAEAAGSEDLLGKLFANPTKLAPLQLAEYLTTIGRQLPIWVQAEARELLDSMPGAVAAQTRAWILFTETMEAKAQQLLHA